MPHGHWKTTTFVAGLRHHGITARLVIDSPMNGAIFKAYVEQMLAPTLSPGDIVIMDNLASHKVSGVRDAIEGRGAKLLWRIIPSRQAAIASRRIRTRPSLSRLVKPRSAYEDRSSRKDFAGIFPSKHNIW